MKLQEFQELLKDSTEVSSNSMLPKNPIVDFFLKIIDKYPYILTGNRDYNDFKSNPGEISKDVVVNLMLWFIKSQRLKISSDTNLRNGKYSDVGLNNIIQDLDINSMDLNFSYNPIKLESNLRQAKVNDAVISEIRNTFSPSKTISKEKFDEEIPSNVILQLKGYKEFMRIIRKPSTRRPALKPNSISEQAENFLKEYDESINSPESHNSQVDSASIPTTSVLDPKTVDIRSNRDRDIMRVLSKASQDPVMQKLLDELISEESSKTAALDPKKADITRSNNDEDSKRVLSKASQDPVMQELLNKLISEEYSGTAAKKPKKNPKK